MSKWPYTKVAIIIALIVIGAPLFYAIENGVHIYTDKDISDIENAARQEGYDEGYETGLEEGQQESLSEAAPEYPIVYYTDDGECYHMNPSCLSLRDSDNIHEIPLDDLYANDPYIRPCDICVPHSDD